MVSIIKIACDATPEHGAGICVFYQEGQTTRYLTYGPKRHNYGKDSSCFEIRNSIEALKRFKGYFDSGAEVELISDNEAILSDDFPDTLALLNQTEQLEGQHGVVIELRHDTIQNSRLMEAADALSRGQIQKCTDILAKCGAHRY